MLAMKPARRLPARARGLHAVALELELDESLRREAWRARSSTRSRTPARAPAWRSRTGSAGARRRRRAAGRRSRVRGLRDPRDARSVGRLQRRLRRRAVKIEGLELHIAVVARLVGTKVNCAGWRRGVAPPSLFACRRPSPRLGSVASNLPCRDTDSYGPRDRKCAQTSRLVGRHGGPCACEGRIVGSISFALFELAPWVRSRHGLRCYDRPYRMPATGVSTPARKSGCTDFGQRRRRHQPPEDECRCLLSRTDAARRSSSLQE